MRSVLAAVAAAWFIYNALFFAPDSAGVALPDGPFGVVTGEPGAVAATIGVRMLCVGLAVLSLALVNWSDAIGMFQLPKDR
jgi:hypothetical protein